MITLKILEKSTLKLYLRLDIPILIYALNHFDLHNPLKYEIEDAEIEFNRRERYKLVYIIKQYMNKYEWNFFISFY